MIETTGDEIGIILYTLGYNIIMDTTISVTKKIIEETKEFTYAIGYFSEMILPIIVLYFIYHDVFAHIVYFLCYFISIYLNIWFKNTIKEPRPKPFFRFLAIESTKKDAQQIYGMPSGHSQNAFYSIVYLYLYLRSVTPVYMTLPTPYFPEYYVWILISLCIGIITILERWLFRNHTMLQLCIGALIGSALGYIIFTVQMEVYDIYTTSSVLRDL